MCTSRVSIGIQWKNQDEAPGKCLAHSTRPVVLLSVWVLLTVPFSSILRHLALPGLLEHLAERASAQASPEPPGILASQGGRGILCFPQNCPSDFICSLNS